MIENVLHLYATISSNWSCVNSDSYHQTLNLNIESLC